MDNANIFWVLKCSVNEGQLDALKSLATEFCTGAEKEDGTIGYQWALTEDDSALHICERFRDNASAVTHLGNVGPHLGKLMEVVTPTGFEVYGPAGDDLREGLSTMGATFHAQFAGFAR